MKNIFEKCCALLDDQHSCAGVLSRNRYVSWLFTVPQVLSITAKVQSQLK